MALTQEQIIKARQEAVRYLEYSTYTICLTLGIDPTNASSLMTIPVAEDHNLYMSYECLIGQLSILEDLSG